MTRFQYKAIDPRGRMSYHLIRGNGHCHDRVLVTKVNYTTCLDVPYDDHSNSVITTLRRT